MRSLLIVARGAESYGILTKLLSLAGEFAGRGWRVTGYAAGDGLFVERMRVIPGVQVIVDPVVPEHFDAERHGRLKGYLRVIGTSRSFVARLRRFLRAHRFDAALFAEHGMVLPIAAAATGIGTPFFWLVPNVVSDAYPFDLNRRLYAAAFRLSGLVPVANSRYTMATLGRSAHDGARIDLGADPARFPPAPIPPGTEGIVRLLVAARLHPEKGHLELLRALLSSPDLASIRLDIAGGPSGTAYEAELLAEARRQSAGDRLRLLGPSDDVSAAYRESDVVASVRLDAEPFGLSIVEAMLSGRPVLAHRLGGPADIVVDGETGWLLPDMSEDMIVTGLRRMLADRARWAAMGAAGLARARERYTVAKMTDGLLRIFEERGVVTTALH
jgi:glycosyltransferase involved in cell wall biosynthesis